MKKKKKNKVAKMFSILLIILSIIFVFSLFCLDILTSSYLIIIALVLGIIDFVSIFLMHRKKRRKIGYLLTILMALVLSFVSFYVLKTNNILSSFHKNYKVYNYSVVVLKDGEYDKIEDIKNKTLGYYKIDGEECDKSLNFLEEKITTSLQGYNDIYSLASSLLDEEIESILIEDSYLDIVKENDSANEKIDGFDELTEVIYTFSIKINISDISEDVDVTKEAFHIYISGIDTYGTVSSVSRSDVNMVATINPKTNQILLTSIPRDYYVALHGVSGYRDKLTHAGLYGVDMSIHTIEDLLNIEINYYIKVNFTSIIDIVNAVGGVNVYSDYTFTSIDGYHYTKGYNSVNGEEALSFARERKAFAEGDRQRIKDQQALMEALFRKCTSKDIIIKYNSLLNSLSDSFVTNMPTDRLTSLIKMQLSKNYDWTITSNSLDGSNSSNYTYSIPNQKSYVMEPKEESVNDAKNLITSVVDGETLTSSYDGDDSNVHSVTKNNSNSSSTNNSSSSSQNSLSSDNKEEGLEAKLIKSSITFVTGDDYIYHGFTATYHKEDITDKTKVKFSVNGATFDNYNDLISYVSSLTPGNYTIIYTITYQNESTNLKQSVTIEDLEEENIENSEITIPEDQTENVEVEDNE